MTDAPAVDPTAEQDLLDTAHREPVGALRRKAKTVKAAAADDEAKREAAQRNRKLRMGTDEETLEGWGHLTGPALVIAELKSLLRPYVEAEFRKARAAGRHEPERARWFITNLSRRANARQQVVLDWLGVLCSNLDCDHTQHLQVDHDIDWATVGITELVNLDWLCPHCHRLKTHRGWKHVGGRGRRPFVPPDHPDQRGRPAA